MKTVTFYTVVLSVILGFGACATAKMDKELAKQIRSDERRKTSETDIYISLDLDGHGRCDISTGLGFFDHMLNKIGLNAAIKQAAEKGYLTSIKTVE